MAHQRGARTDPESRRTACAGFQPGSPGARPRLSCCTGHGAGRSRESSFEAALMGTVSSLGELTPSLAPPPGQFFQFKGFSLYGPEIFPTRNPHQFLPKDLQAHGTFSSTGCQAAMRCLPSASLTRAYRSLSTWPLEGAVCGRGAGALTSSVHQMA